MNLSCTCGVKFTGGLCSDWCDLIRKDPRVPHDVWDVSGDDFVKGTTNFTIMNLYDCLQSINEETNWNQCKVYVQFSLFDILNDEGIVQYSQNLGNYHIQQLIVYGCDLGQNGSIKDSNVITPSRDIVLRTREY